MTEGAAAHDETVHETVTSTPSAAKLGAVEGEAVASAMEGSNDSASGAGGDGGSGHAWDVYCDGPLLAAMQNAGLFPDSKTFVDMPMKKVMTAFNVSPVCSSPRHLFVGGDGCLFGTRPSLVCW